MNVAICDDEQPGRSRIRSLVQRQGMECQIEEFPSGQTLLQAIDGAGGWPDILFLDISMDGMDGISVAKELRARLRESQEPVWGSLPLLIFVSGRPEYMPEAFGVNAFQFLVKPFGEADFNRVFTQAAQEYSFLAAQKQKKPKEYQEHPRRGHLLCGKQQPEGYPVPRAGKVRILWQNQPPGAGTGQRLFPGA